MKNKGRVKREEGRGVSEEEIQEAATELPAFLGCPQHMPTRSPGGFDGTEPAPNKRSEVEKLNEILFERLGEIAKFASNKSIEFDPQFTDGSSAEKNIKLFGAFSELRQMLDFYKPREKPVDPTAPEMKVSKQEAFNRRTWSFCDGLFPIIHIDTPEGFMARCKINGRTFRESVIKEDVACEDKQDWNGYVYDKGACVCMVSGMGKGKNAVKLMTHAAFMAYVKQLSGGGKKYHNKRGFLRQNAARARAAAST